jgi:hypothetical protein
MSLSTKWIFFASFSFGAIASPQSARAESADCVGGVQIDGGILTCNIDYLYADPSLNDQTFGIVKAIHAEAKLSIDGGKITELLQTEAIRIPVQTVNFQVQTSGSPIVLSVTLAPIIPIEVVDGKPHAHDASANITDITGNLPPWINNYLKKKLNEAPALKSQLTNGANKLLEKMQ